MPAKESVPTWLYHKERGGKIHALVPGAPPPKGWRDTPWPNPRAQESSSRGEDPETRAERGRVSPKSQKTAPRKE